MLLTIPSMPNTILAQETNTYKIGFIFDLLPENAPILLDIMHMKFALELDKMRIFYFQALVFM